MPKNHNDNKGRTDDSIIIRETLDRTWRGYYKVYSFDIENMLPSALTKLHLRVSQEAYAILLPKLKALLLQALDDDVIVGFKYWAELDAHANKEHLELLAATIHSLKKLRRAIDGEIVTIFDFDLIIYQKHFKKELTKDFLNTDMSHLREKAEKNIYYYEKVLFADKRLLHNPFAIYLPKEMNAHRIATLCKELEKILQGVARNPSYLSIADLPVLPHVSFRQERLNEDDVYISIAEATPSQLHALREEALHSELYCSLKDILIIQPLHDFAQEIVTANSSAKEALFALHEHIAQEAKASPLIDPVHFGVIENLCRLLIRIATEDEVELNDFFTNLYLDLMEIPYSFPLKLRAAQTALAEAMPEKTVSNSSLRFTGLFTPPPIAAANEVLSAITQFLLRG